MDHKGDVFISIKYKKDDYTNLKLTTISDADEWGKAISIFDDRIKGRYIAPIVKLINEDANANGFAVMAIVCLLIETLCQFKNGVDKSTEKQNKVDYSIFLGGLLKANGIADSYRIAEKFYKDIRCGILHQGQTNNGSKLSTADDSLIWIENKCIIVSVKRFTECIISYFENYKTQLLDINQTDLREKFIKKMNYICGNRISNSRRSSHVNP